LSFFDTGLTVCRLQDEAIGSWVLTRVIDGQERPEFVFDNAMRIKPNGRVKVNLTDLLHEK